MAIQFDEDKLRDTALAVQLLNPATQGMDLAAYMRRCAEEMDPPSYANGSYFSTFGFMLTIWNDDSGQAHCAASVAAYTVLSYLERKTS